MKKALIIVGQYTQDQEFIYPYYRLQEADYQVDVAADGDRPANPTTANGIKLPVTCNFGGMKYDNDLLVLPGGAKALEYLRQNELLIRFIRMFYHQKNTIIASICHGAQLLISADIIKGKRISGYYSIKDDINNAGAIYVDEPAVVDDRIVTSPHYKYLGQWMKAVLEQVK